MAATPPPLVTRVALRAFTRRLVDLFAPEKVILFGSRARGDDRWDSDLETYLRAVLIARDILTQAALAHLDPGEGDPEPIQDRPWALAEARPLRDSLRHWFDSQETFEIQEAEPQEVA